MPRAAWVAVALLTAGVANPALAQPLEPFAPAGGPPLASTPVTPARNLERPPPVLGAPVEVTDRAPATPTAIPASFEEPSKPRPQRAASFGAPSAAPSFGGPNPGPPAAPVPAAVVEAPVSRAGHRE